MKNLVIAVIAFLLIHNQLSLMAESINEQISEIAVYIKSSKINTLRRLL